MPSITPHYDLTYFNAGDAYSASADRRRFTIIDNAIAFLADAIGDGIIDGWQISSLGGNRIRVGPGIGVIGGFVTTSSGNYDFDLLDNRRSYVYMRRKPGILASVGEFCDIESITYSDIAAPVAPSNLKVVSADFNAISLSWAANTEPDLNRYSVWRSTDGTTFSKIDSVTQNAYVDQSVQQNTPYWYYVTASDLNANVSSASSTVSVSTSLDSRVPSDPSDVDLLVGNGTLQVYWGAGIFLVDKYRLYIQPIDSEGVPDGSADVRDYSANTYNAILPGLINGQLYSITVKSVSPTGVESPGVVVRGVPVYSGGPQEIDSITASDYALDTSYSVAIDINWTLQSDEYFPLPAYYLVTVSANNETGIPSVYTTNSITLVRYPVQTSGGGEAVRDLQQETNYTIKIQSVTDDGVPSNGFILRYKTKRFEPPKPVTNLSFSVDYTATRRVFTVSWNNSISDFAYNRITIRKVYVNSSSSSSSETYVEYNSNIGTANTYTLSRAEIENFTRYEFYITVVDIYGNESVEVTADTVIAVHFGSAAVINGVLLPNGDARPPVPSQQTCVSGNGQTTIYWNTADSDIIANYKVWRAAFAPSYTATSWTLIATLPSDAYKFTDYTSENGKAYVYFVTTKDLLGNESPNPSQDGFYNYTYSYSSPRGHTALTKAPAISLSADANDVIIQWTVDGEPFDGFEIYRSDNNAYSFKKIGVADGLQNSFTDANALLLSGTYYYMIRKFTNECEAYISSSIISSIGSIVLGTVTMTSGMASIDASTITDLELLRDPIKNEVSAEFKNHVHTFNGISDDRRVRLSETLVIDDWSSDDGIIWTTSIGLSGTGAYVAYINGQQSTFNSAVDTAAGTITFETAIRDPQASSSSSGINSTPFLRVIFTNVGEVTSNLDTDNLSIISATKITKGILSADVLPQIDHFGRMNEICLPVRQPLNRVTGHLYTGSTPLGTTFYDVLTTGDDRILAATSNGIQITDVGGGNRWTTLLSTGLPPTKLYYSGSYSTYYAAIGNEVRYSTDLQTWHVIEGMSGVSFVRDFIEDDEGNLFASSDAGVYRINPAEYVKQFWSQTSNISVLDGNAYAMAFIDGYVVVAGSDGLYRSNDDGVTWNKWSGDELSVPVHSILTDGDFIFLVSTNKVWRSSGGAYRVIADLPFICRKAVLFGGSIYLTTDAGIQRSSTNADVYSNDVVDFVSTLSIINRNGKSVPVYGLRTIGSRMWLGTDDRIYSVTSKLKVYLHADAASVCPTVFVNGVIRNVGVYYTRSNTVMFDSRLLPQDVVEIVSDYTKVQAINGGWAEQKYDANVTIKVNSSAIGSGVPPTDAKTINTAVQQIVTPFFSSRNSNFTAANKDLFAIIRTVDDIATMLDTMNATGQVVNVPADTISQLFGYLADFSANVHDDIRGQIIIPPITGSAGSATFDVVNGNVTLANAIDRFSDVLISIEGVSLTNTGELSHSEIESAFEKVNSGLPTNLADTRYANLIKAGIYDQIKDPYGRKDANLLYQSAFYAACDDWYDKFNSTVDYQQMVAQEPIHHVTTRFDTYGFAINYPSDVIYVESLNEVWVSGSGGIIAVNADSYSTRLVYRTKFYVFNLHIDQNVVYALAEDGLYSINFSGIVTKNVDIQLPQGYSSVLVFGDTVYVATPTGLFSKRTFETDWTPVLNVNNAFVRSTDAITFCVGIDPLNQNANLVFYSHSGVIWNRSSSFTDIQINSVTQRYDSVYYATDQGLLIEDLSRLYAQSSDNTPSISLAQLNGEDGNNNVVINDVHADATKVVCGSKDGIAYTLSGGSVTDSVQSRLETIHKVRVVNGKYWLFADDLIDIEDAPKLIQLSIGRVIS